MGSLNLYLPLYGMEILPPMALARMEVATLPEPVSAADHQAAQSLLALANFIERRVRSSKAEISYMVDTLLLDLELRYLQSRARGTP